MHFLLTNLGKSLSSEFASNKFTIFWNSIFIQYAKNKLRSLMIFYFFFWWDVNLFYFLCFFFWFTYWSNFISYFIPSQISSCFCSVLDYSFRRGFYCVYSSLAVSINFLPYLSPNVLVNDKNLYPLTYFLYFGSILFL